MTKTREYTLYFRNEADDTVDYVTEAQNINIVCEEILQVCRGRLNGYALYRLETPTSTIDCNELFQAQIELYNAREHFFYVEDYPEEFAREDDYAQALTDTKRDYDDSLRNVKVAIYDIEKHSLR